MLSPKIIHVLRPRHQRLPRINSPSKKKLAIFALDLSWLRHMCHHQLFFSSEYFAVTDLRSNLMIFSPKLIHTVSLYGCEFSTARRNSTIIIGPLVFHPESARGHRYFPPQFPALSGGVFPIQHAAHIHIPHHVHHRPAAIQKPVHRQQQPDIFLRQPHCPEHRAAIVTIPASGMPPRAPTLATIDVNTTNICRPIPRCRPSNFAR